MITHEHSDHIKGLGVLARKHHVPIYGTKETLEEVAANTKIRGISEGTSASGPARCRF